MPNALDSLVDNPQLFQDLINIQLPQYHIPGVPPPLTPTSATPYVPNASATPPVNTMVFSTS